MPVTRSQACWTRIPLAGSGQESLLSEVGSQYLLPLFTTAEACALRLVCREFLAAVSEQSWEDKETVIKGSIRAWRACFPRALSASVAQYKGLPAWRSTPVVDADFEHLEGLRYLDMRGCTSVTDAAFEHLHGIRMLFMVGCFQEGITDAAFAHLRGIRLLNMSECCQEGITDAAFAHLRGVRSLDMRGCAHARVVAARALGLPV